MAVNRAAGLPVGRAVELQANVSPGRGIVMGDRITQSISSCTAEVSAKGQVKLVPKVYDPDGHRAAEIALDILEQVAAQAEGRPPRRPFVLQRRFPASVVNIMGEVVTPPPVDLAEFDDTDIPSEPAQPAADGQLFPAAPPATAATTAQLGDKKVTDEIDLGEEPF